jgi:F-type H+-transporting ATPase subunit delta
VVSVERKKEALSEVLGSHISKATLKFLEFLVDKKRTAVLPSVTARYEELMNEMMGLLRAKIVTAAPIDLEQRESLVNKLGILTKRKKVELEEAVDPSIIGGAIVSYDDRSIDGSLRTQLALLRERMKEVRVA